MPKKRKLFDKSLYERAKNDLYKIEIGNIRGILKDNFVMNMSATWDTLISLDGAFSTLRTALGVAGIGLFNSGIFTRKFYKGGSYIEINPTFRVVDWDGTPENSVIDISKTLYSYVIPKAILTDKDGKNKTNLGGFSGKTYQQATNFLNRLRTSLANNAPSTVRVRLSNFFSFNDMAITSVSVTYSKEMTVNGPLYADFNVSLTSAEVPNFGTLNKTLVKPRNRVRYE